MTTPTIGQEPIQVDKADAGDLQLWSVTTIIGVLDKPALLYWAAQQTADAAIDKQATWSAMLEDEGRDAAAKWLRDARFRSPRTILSAADLGIIAHKVCETYALTGTRPDREFITNEVALKGTNDLDIAGETDTVTAMLDQFDGWLQRFTPSYQATEVAVYNATYGYAGQADGFMTIDGTRFLFDYKALDRNTPLATPEGWTTMGAIQVGDKVFGTNGQPVTVTAKSRIHTRPCYRVTFDDTTSIVCDADHLWTVASTYNNKQRIKQTLTTRQLAQELCSRVTGQKHWAIEMPAPLQLPEVDLPIDPYVYGCWLGDGTKNYGTITKPDNELFDNITARGFTVGPTIDAKKLTRTVYGLRTKLRHAGLIGHRSIPGAYLRASASQRLELLRGLMDTDGSWNKTRKHAVFSTTDKATAESVYELAVSLGERPLISTINAHGFGKDITAYHVGWRPRVNNPFLLTRKAENIELSEGHSWRRMITAIEPTVIVPTQCITVDAEDGCYLAGTQMVPTHNTSRDTYDARGNLKTPYPEQVALQLAAYRYAEHAAVWRPRRLEKFRRRYYLLSPEEQAMAVPVPEVDTGLVIKLTPESCESYPIRCDQEVHRAFLYVLEAFRWTQETSKTVMRQPLSSAKS